MPDQASFSIDIKGGGETSEDALTETNRLVKMVRTRLHDNDVDQKYIKTEDISTYPEISYELDDKGTVNGYKAYTTISVKDIDIKTAEKYPVAETVCAGIPASFNTVAKESAHPFKLRSKITISE